MCMCNNPTAINIPKKVTFKIGKSTFNVFRMTCSFRVRDFDCSHKDRLKDGCIFQSCPFAARSNADEKND